LRAGIPWAIVVAAAMDPEGDVQAAEVVVPCAELHATLAFFTERLGFRLDSIFPADDPSVATVSGHGLRIRLERGGDGRPGVLRLLCRDPAAFAGGVTTLTAPNGTRIELVDVDPPIVLPPARPSFVVTRRSGDAPWVQGRAGMRYRDLVPDRQGGRVIASHIQIPDAGPVPDYVHFHRIRFQMIHCHRGWVRVVYEDQGPPFVLRAGDCVLQPPRIRHRVLEAAAGTEVVEIGSPANHETCVDYELRLPTATERRDRVFDGQRFVRHEAASAEWRAGRRAGFEARDTGIGEATSGLAEVHVLRRRGPERPEAWRHEGELLFAFVLRGGATLACEGRAEERLTEGDACVVPSGQEHTWAECDAGVELLEVVVAKSAA
jgi:quercetin dioxygenase-like cupin family protein